MFWHVFTSILRVKLREEHQDMPVVAVTVFRKALVQGCKDLSVHGGNNNGKGLSHVVFGHEQNYEKDHEYEIKRRIDTGRQAFDEHIP